MPDLVPEQQINLGQIVGKDHKYELSVSNESPEDATARRDREAADAGLKRKISFGIFLFATAMTAAVFCGCIYIFATGTPEDKKWAGGIVSAVASGSVGFLVGQGKK